MRRYSDSKFQARFSGLMVIYALLVAIVLPYANGLQSVPAKASLTVLPVVPMILAILLWARQIAHSDERTQRFHLVSLGIAAGVVSVASVVAALLLTLFSVRVSGTILFWIMPALWVIYGILRKAMKWRKENQNS